MLFCLLHKWNMRRESRFKICLKIEDIGSGLELLNNKKLWNLHKWAIPCGFKVQNLSALYYIICVGINIISHYNSFILSVKASHLVRRSQKTKKTQKKKTKQKVGALDWLSRTNLVRGLRHYSIHFGFMQKWDNDNAFKRNVWNAHNALLNFIKDN